MALRGERFELDLDPEDAFLGSQPEHDTENQPQPRSPLGFDFVKDVLEREPAESKPPEPPKFKQTATGFPAHKKRTGPSRFKQQRAGADTVTPARKPATRDATPGRYLDAFSNASADEKKSIDQQTTQMIESMSPEELAEARRELLSESSVSMIQKLLNRSTIDDQPEKEFPRPSPTTTLRKDVSNPVSATKKSVSLAESSPSILPKPVSSPTFDGDAPPPTLPSDPQSVTAHPVHLNSDSILAPEQGSVDKSATKSSNPPTLDPSSESFLSDLHSTYFPDLPADPNQLAWMAPVPDDPEATTQSGDANQTPPAELRFDFRGSIVTKSRSAAIPVTKGLHHHGNDPGSAGYTINELSIYSRSTVAAQRCFAYQLLGRILYRLGNGDFGEEQSQQVQGLYDEFKRGYILDQLLQEAARDPGTGSESARVWALEAVWLWRKGGGKGLDNVGVPDEEIMGEAAGRILAEGLNPP